MDTQKAEAEARAKMEADASKASADAESEADDTRFLRNQVRPRAAAARHATSAKPSLACTCQQAGETSPDQAP
jgi:hypothetical protein